MVIRERLSAKEIQDLKNQFGEAAGKRSEELNTKEGKRGVQENVKMRGELEVLGLDPGVAAKIADRVSEKGTIKGKEDALADTIVELGYSPAGLKDTGRSAKDNLKLTADYLLLGGTDPSKMSPEFVRDVEAAVRSEATGECVFLSGTR